MNKEELKLNDKELHKYIDELKGTQFLSAFCILDWIIKMRNENEELKQRINKAIDKIEMEQIRRYLLIPEEEVLKILKGEDQKE